MKYVKARWLVTLALLGLPYLLLFIAGSLWLYEYGMLLYWFVVSLAVTWIGWALMKGIQGAEPPARVEPDLEWPPAGHEAWKEVEALAQQIEARDLPLDRPETAWQVLGEVLQLVARHYHPGSQQAWLEIPVPYAMRIVELVSKDLREATSAYVPGSHILTISDWQRLWQLAGWANRSYFWYRIVSFIVNSPAALVREARDAVLGRLQGVSGAAIKRWAIGFSVRRAGYYAIQLYGGYLVLDEVKFLPFSTGQSQDDARRAPQRDARLAAEPLRILVAGQVKAGKSSLINAMFGEYRAATDVVPRTAYVEPYVLEREGIQRAILLDTAGYDDAAPGAAFGRIQQQVLNCDLVLIVVSAVSAARRSDREFLDAMRGFFQNEPNRHMPAVLVALTHVDQLRPPGEWNPPYDLARPAGPKARHMVEAMQAVAEDLSVAQSEIVPVCLTPGQWYNVEDALVPAIAQQLPQAQRVRYLRCLRHFHEEEYWERLRQQAVQAGRILIDKLQGK